VEATERNEVKGFGFLEPLQAGRHGAIVTSLGPCPGPAHRDDAAMNVAQLPYQDKAATSVPIESRGFPCLRIETWGSRQMK